MLYPFELRAPKRLLSHELVYRSREKKRRSRRTFSAKPYILNLFGCVL